MKTYELCTIPATPARETKRCSGRACDLCGKQAQGDEWSNSSCYDVNETEITVKVLKSSGTNYPDGHDVSIWDIDICPDCFETELIPWLRSKGAKIEKTEESW